VAGAYVVIVAEEPVLYLERGGRGLLTLLDAPARTAGAAGRERDPLHEALVALAEAVRAGRVPKVALERIDGEPAIASALAPALVELGFQSGPRRLTLSA
jgi:ATP-dependent Lhr-like helicase